ncbi:MAG: electron transfer flavoprotein subunit alpha/FixB family protein [Terriglobales bacterium]
MEKILFLAFTESDGTLHRTALEALGGALELGTVTIGLIGGDVQSAASAVASAGAKILAVAGAEFAQPRYASDAAAAEAICRAANPQIVVAPAGSRTARVLPGVAHRLGGRIDTHITAIATDSGKLTVTRWYYRQRMEAVLERAQRPWFILLEAGSHSAYAGAPGTAAVELVSVALTDAHVRTKVTGIRAPQSDQQTIRPDAKLLFVAGAGWTKKQPDGQVHGADAEQIILDFLGKSGASLGGSKSLVDQSGEGQAVLRFMSHLNQVGQTGATPRHPKGLSTCCHGEEPHVVGWRFINERRAVNLDPNCGWARGKADVLYVADAFEVMRKVSALLAEKAKGAGA